MSIQWPGAKSDFVFESFDLDRPGLRLLRLKPARAQETPIECQLVQAFLDEDVIEYEAISYTWGSLNSLQSIILDGLTFFAPLNLCSLLRDVRLPDQDRILWVDAVCINQSDERERGHQVQQMGQIYRQAERVIIWLGPLTSSPISLLMNSLVILQQQTRGVSWPLNDPRWRIHWDQVTKGLPDILYSAFLEILERPWFRRVWVLQEVANAQRALVHCGPKAILAKIFALCPMLLNFQPDSHCQAVLDVMPGPSRRESWWTQDRRLLTLLKKFSNTEATVEHDRIFALLGMCPEANARIPVDYFMSIPQLIRETIAYVLSDDIFTFDIQYLQGIDYHSIRELVRDAELLHTKGLGNLLQFAPFHTVEAFVLQYHDEIASAPVLSLQTPLSIACMKGHEAIARLLLDQGVDARPNDLSEAFRGEHGAIVRLLLDRGEPYTEVALNFACIQGHEALVRLLLDRGAPVTNEALENTYWKGNETIVRLLLDRGAPATGEAFKVACRKGYESIVRHLLEQGAPPTAMALLVSSEFGHNGIVRILLDHDLAVDSSDTIGQTPLMMASMKGHEDVVRTLLDAGADFNRRGPFGDSPLGSALRRKHEGVAQLLRSRGACY